MWSEINKTYLINTNDTIGKCRLPIAAKELNSHGISFDKYPAIINENGELGLIQTMKKLFEENINCNILVFEDDIEILHNRIYDFIEMIIEQVPDDFDLLYLGCNLLVPPVKVSKNILKIRAAYSSHSVLYSKKGIDLILSLWKENQPYDNFLMTEIQPYGNCFCTYPILCSQRIGESSIFKYDPKKQIGIEKYYNVSTKEIDWGLLMKEQFNLMTKNL